jgi:hypothetical protein
MFADFHRVMIDDRLAVETYVSQLLGAIWSVCEGVPEAEYRLCGEFIDYLADRRDPGGAAVLAALSTLAPGRSLRSEARVELEALRDKNIPVPAWLRTPVRVTECWVGGDVFAENTTVLCIAEGGNLRHGIVALLDNDSPPSGPQLADVFVTAEPDQVIRALGEPEAPGELTMPATRLEPARATELLRAAIAGCELTEPEDRESTVLQLRALLAARCRTVSETPVRPRPPAPTQGQINRVMNDFLSAPHAALLPRTEALIAAVDLIVGFHLPGGLRVGPAITQTFLHDCVPARVESDNEILTVLVPVLRAFNRWVAGEAGLPAKAVELLDQRTESCALTFRDAIPDSDRDIPPDWPGLFD